MDAGPAAADHELPCRQRRLPLEQRASADDFRLQGAATLVQFDFYKTGSAVQATRSAGCVASDAKLDYALLRLPADAPDRPPLRLRTSYITKPQRSRAENG